MIAVRALSRALRSAHAASERLRAFPPTQDCLKAVRRMNVCPTCSPSAASEQPAKPCANYCINVMKGCLAYHIEAQETWDKLVGQSRN